MRTVRHAGIAAMVGALLTCSGRPEARAPLAYRTPLSEGEARADFGASADTLETVSGFLPVDGLRLFYRTIGEGDPVVVLHGGPSPGHGYLIPWITRLGRHHRVILFDQRGTGRSDAPADSTSLNRAVLVEDVDRIRRGLNVETPFHLLGHSWGGLLALEYALRHPDAVGSLVLAGTTEPGELYREEVGAALERRKTEADSARLARLFGSEGFRRGDPALIERIYQLTYRPWLGRPGVASHLSFRLDGETARKGRRTARFVVANSGPPDHWAELSSLEVPTLLVHGERDPIPVAMVRRLADSLPRARLEVLNGVGHFPFAEAPDAFFAVVSRFLEAPVRSTGSGPAARADSHRDFPRRTEVILK